MSSAYAAWFIPYGWHILLMHMFAQSVHILPICSLNANNRQVIISSVQSRIVIQSIMYSIFSII
jgi:hypothetical protein